MLQNLNNATQKTTMCIAGYLSDFSLPKIFHLIEKGQQTGLLTLHSCLQTQASTVAVHYIWVYQGRLVALANQLDSQGLVSLIAQRQWLGEFLFTQLVQSCPSHQPLGSYLKQKKVLQAQQLKWLFQVQVLQAMRTLFQLKDAQYEFNCDAQIPMLEMTGLSLSATDTTLMGLRSLKNWHAFADQLPDPNRGLVSTISRYPHNQLNTLEWQVWEYTNGTVSLKAIARQLKLPLKQVQQIAFRLNAVGLVEQAPLFVDTSSTQAINTLPAQLLQEAERRKVRHSFLQNFVEFLGSQT